MHKVILLIACLFISSSTFAIDYSSRIKNHNNYELNNLNRAEYAVLGRNNGSLAPETRLALMERQMFGTIQPGSFNDRVNFINRVLANSQNPYYRTNFNNIRRANRVKAALNEIFNGNMTGYTPPVYAPNINYRGMALPYGKYVNPYRYNTAIPQPYGSGTANFITQTRVLIDN